MTSTTTIYEYEHAHEREHEGCWGKASNGERESEVKRPISVAGHQRALSPVEKLRPPPRS
jgi:hypothetical protein